MHATLASKGPETAHAGHDPRRVPEPPPMALRETAGDLPVFLQGTPALSHPGDADEREAERLARKVVPMDARRGSRSGQTSTDRSSASGRAPLSSGMRSRIEPVVGADLSEVRVRTGAAAERAAAAIGARAFTHDGGIWLGVGQRADNVALMAHEAAHVVQQRNGRDGVIHRFVDFDVTNTTITAEALTDITDEELDEEILVLRDHARTLLQDTPEYETATENMTVLEKEVKRRADAARVPPVIFGMDTDTRAIYASVTVPGHTVTEISTYVYGSADKAAEIQSTNGVEERVPPGRNLRLPPGALSEGASTEVDQALETGSILRTEGIPEGDASDGEVLIYRFAAGGRRYELTEGQLRGMLQGLGVWIYRKADYVHGLAENGYEVHDDHLRETNSVVRGISDWMADQDELSLTVWDSALSESQGVLDALKEADFNADDVEIGLAEVPAQAQNLASAAAALDDAQAQWHQYIEGTIAGAEVTIHRLEIVRNVSFGVAAGLAGAIAAPAVFAAAGGGLLGGGLALGAGTAAGAGTGAALEFTGAVGGEALGAAVTPGEQNIDWDYVGGRTWEGTKSGAIQGGVGAAGALVAPGLGNVISNRLFGTGTAGLTTSGARMTVNALTGTAVGLPSGAAGAALENAGAYSRGTSPARRTPHRSDGAAPSARAAERRSRSSPSEVSTKPADNASILSAAAPSHRGGCSPASDRRCPKGPSSPTGTRRRDSTGSRSASCRRCARATPGWRSAGATSPWRSTAR